ncbi:MAG: SRPBCC family protein [Bacteroidota bacterium]
MKIIKKLLIAVVGLIVLVLIIAIFVKKEYAVEREVVINKPKSEVFEYIKYLKNQDSFSVWAMKDPNMKKEYKGEDGTVGFISAWDSEMKDVGKGEQEIKGIIEGAKVEYELRFIKPFEATDDAYMITEAAADNHTTVKWGFRGKMDYPMNFMLLFMDMEDMLGKDLQQGLNNLKEQIEKK